MVINHIQCHIHYDVYDTHMLISCTRFTRASRDCFTTRFYGGHKDSQPRVRSDWRRLPLMPHVLPQSSKRLASTYIRATASVDTEMMPKSKRLRHNKYATTICLRANAFMKDKTTQKRIPCLVRTHTNNSKNAFNVPRQFEFNWTIHKLATTHALGHILWWRAQS